ncbi:MAG: lysostaphin resistance A-like protein [Terriglobales bacterium]
MGFWFSQPDSRTFASLRAGWRVAVFVLLAAGIPGALVMLALLLRTQAGAAAATGGGLVSPWMTAINEAVLFFWILFITWIMARLERRPLGSYGLRGRQVFGGMFWRGVLWGVIALSVLLLLIFFSGDMAFGDLVLRGAAIPRFGLEWALSFLAVGFFEEYCFRGYALTTLSQGTGFWTAAIILSAGFGGVHLFNGGEAWMGALSAGLIGLFFCFTWQRTGSLWFAVGMHAAWDFCESWVYGVPDSGTISRGRLLQPTFHGSHWITGGSIGPEGSLWVFLIVALLFALFADLYPARHPPGVAQVAQEASATDPT